MTTVIKSQTIRMRKYPIIDEILRWFTCIYIHYRQKGWNIWKVQWNHSYLIFWFAGNGMAPMTNMYCNFNATLVCGVMEEKCNMQCPKLKRHNRVLRNVSFFYTSPKLLPNIQDIHHYIVNVCEFCVSIIILHWHHTKFATGRRITIWAQNQNGKKEWLRVHHLVIWYPMENLLRLSKNDLYKWSRFSSGC